MKQMLVLIFLMCVSLLSASSLEQYATMGSVLTGRLQSLRLSPMVEPTAETIADDAPIPTTKVTRTLAFPFQQAQIQINAMKWMVFDLEGNFLCEEQQTYASALQVSACIQFREMTAYTLSIQTQIQTDDGIRTLKEVDFALIGSQPAVIPTTISPAFIAAYRALADNFEQSYLRNIPLARPRMLIISHTQLAPYQTEFIKWKRSLGFDVYVANLSETGNTIQGLRSYISNHYQQYHCDYLFLWGDVIGTFAIPTNFYPSPEYAENDADDNYYTMLEGDDYFPEMIVGRFSFTDVSQFITLLNKTISYERAPFSADPTWMTRALVVAGNYAEGTLRPTTPIAMSIWLRNKMLDYGYTQVDSVFCPYTFPGTSSICQSINQGVQFVSYRGWGDANGWHYPSFHISDLTPDNLWNGAKMPIVFSIVCNTGDFANAQVNACFGETWMRMGTMSSPGGCIAFVGPSDLHTKTRLNNSISSGAFRSILDYGVRGFGSSVLIGKIELYKNFPNDIAPGQYVPFYYRVYNVLSDPSLNMWVLEPDTIPESVIQSGLSYAQSDNHIRINAANLEGATVSGTKNGTDFLYTQIKDGYAILPIDPTQEGNLTLTISKPNFVPLVSELIPERNATIGIISNSLANSYINPSSSYNLALSFKNFSTTAYTAIQVIASASHTGIAFSQATQTIASLAEGDIYELTFTFSTNGTLSPNEIIDFTITIPNLGEVHMFQLAAGGARIVVYNHSGIISAGTQNMVDFTVCNTGNVVMSDINMSLVSLTTGANAQTEAISIGNLEPGQEKHFNAMITLAPNAFDGYSIPLRFTASNATGYSYICFYSAVAGNPGTDDPTGPDEYGYFAYQSADFGFAQTPDYNWVEIDPREGGEGEVFLVKDDGSITVPLPFSFRFYGVEYNSVTICSNGWMSFVPTDMVDFYNCYIPAALGPYAMVAAYWDDLKGKKTGVDNDGNGIFNDMRLCYWHDAANNRYIVEWNDAYNQYNIDLMDEASLEKFQVILSPQSTNDGKIVVQYHTIDNPGTTTNFCTVGIEDHTQMRGLTYTHANTYPLTAATLSNGTAISFTTLAPDNFVTVEDELYPLHITELKNYPNPFNPSTTITFTAKHAGKAKLQVFNLKGQLVKTLFCGDLMPGKHQFVWDGVDNRGNPIGSGVFFYKLELGDYRAKRKMLLMK